jgi:hypothetical protein
LFVTVITKKLTSQELDASVEASGPHDFAVRKVTLSSGAPPHVHRIPSYVRDDRETPLVEERDDWVVKMIWTKNEAEYFCKQDWTGQISLMRHEKLDFRRRAITRAEADTVSPVPSG